MRPSLSTRALVTLLWLQRSKATFADTNALHQSIRTSQRPERDRPARRVRRRLAVHKREIQGRPCFTLRPRESKSTRHVLYLHGGAYVHQIQRDHWTFFKRLIDHTGCAVTVPLYPLAPLHHYEETVAMVRAAYDTMLAGAEPSDQILMGDSAGGGLALITAQSLRARGEPAPKETVLISPWLDLTMSDPTVPILDRLDPFLSAPGLIEAGQLYADGRDVRDPLLSPINGELADLGRLSVFIGTRDILLADSRQLRDRTRQRGIPLEYHEYPGMFHAWVLSNTPEARDATARIARIVQRRP